ncbi:hypothetical protein QDA02_gp66 [Microbacterium phage Margaery]|uniref:Uncharacterized protein n=1 Tax=Microbacterium phage Margaery TaxID=2591217 RepID=A0A514DHL7_9CAUD|nr:hypothetical protein QDA02_gp66 [Microbacterium phage Margaery]QDH93099.1 hypothetical protein PBI_MARGAERY_42 [Microbacterium phage Margaery]
MTHDTEPLPADLASPRPSRRGTFAVVSVGLLALAVATLAAVGITFI